LPMGDGVLVRFCSAVSPVARALSPIALGDWGRDPPLPWFVRMLPERSQSMESVIPPLDWDRALPLVDGVLVRCCSA
jgi:hypothetical protein